MGALARRQGRHRARLEGESLVHGAVLAAPCTRTRAVEKQKTSISIQTLVISAVAAVAAAVVIPMIWERGTLIATAMTPVIVALVSEGLRKPAAVITATTKRSATGLAVRSPERFEPLPPEERDFAPDVSEDDPFGLRAPARPRVSHHWKLALVTGVCAFVLAVVFLTGSELVFGGPATKESGRTTFFGSRSTPTATPTATPETDEATPTATPAATETPTPTPTPTVTPTATPSPQTAPAPTATATP
jgi:hypothetical protein